MGHSGRDPLGRARQRRTPCKVGRVALCKPLGAGRGLWRSGDTRTPCVRQATPLPQHRAASEAPTSLPRAPTPTPTQPGAARSSAVMLRLTSRNRFHCPASRSYWDTVLSHCLSSRKLPPAGRPVATARACAHQAAAHTHSTAGARSIWGRRHGGRVTPGPGPRVLARTGSGHRRPGAGGEVGLGAKLVSRSALPDALDRLLEPLPGAAPGSRGRRPRRPQAQSAGAHPRTPLRSARTPFARPPAPSPSGVPPPPGPPSSPDPSCRSSGCDLAGAEDSASARPRIRLPPAPHRLRRGRRPASLPRAGGSGRFCTGAHAAPGRSLCPPLPCDSELLPAEEGRDLRTTWCVTVGALRTSRV